jgi:hypothetical protein
VKGPEPEDRKFLKAAQAAWKKYGTQILATWRERPEQNAIEYPQAFVRWGDPAKLTD